MRGVGSGPPLEGRASLPRSALGRRDLLDAPPEARRPILDAEKYGTVGREGGGAAGDILDAAIELFGRRGYEKTTIRGLAAQAGCSAANLYHHHRSKYQLFVTLIERAMDLHLEALQEAMVAHDDPVEQLRAVFECHLRLHMERPEVRLLGNDFHPLEGEELTRFIARRDRYERGVREIVARAARMGRVRVEDPKLAVMAALTACTHVDRWYRPDGELPSREIARRIAAFLLAGFGASCPAAGDRAGPARDG
jgi:AcrR family transcriptional regulator